MNVAVPICPRMSSKLLTANDPVTTWMAVSWEKAKGERRKAKTNVFELQDFQGIVIWSKRSVKIACLSK